MAIENVQQLLTEQLGKNTVEVFTGAVTSKNYYAVHFPVTSVITSITAANATGESALETTMPAGTTLFLNITALTISSGVAIGYVE
ncbi:MAG: hypothetical protein Tp178DCM178821_15 [Prokaryotic dsDNA virus sp.]|nr:MAG: hypothetical protein Tp178DCM178821_15 [Prokaryotic dsDNA virus sp.]|tara:strand:+ start:21129 stop:21386 length:258 start_codon:yes stop_codon:yes gene_type:complete